VAKNVSLLKSRDIPKPHQYNGFHSILGQYINYRLALRTIYPHHRLYLAIPEEVFGTFFRREFAQLSLKENYVALLVYDTEKEVIIDEINP
jgi:hypothetical protein